MIQRIRYRGLRQLYQGRSVRGIDGNHAEKLRRMLTVLDVATMPSDMDLPGRRLHPLKVDRSGTWAVSVSGNWRLTWRFEGEHATDVDYEDYH